MNALQILQPKQELTELEQLIAAEASHEETAFDFIPQRIGMPSGKANFFDIGGDPVKEFSAIVAVSQKARAYWPQKDQLGIPPMCSSGDGVTGWVLQDVPMEQKKAADHAVIYHPVLPVLDNTNERGPYTCARCPLSAFGSDPNGKRGQACKALRRLVLLVEGYRMPVLFTLPPTSVKAWDEYCSALSNRKSQYFAVWTKFTLDKRTNADGVDYAVVSLSPTSKIEKIEELRAVIDVRNQFRDWIASAPIVADEYATTESEEMPPF